ncbi:hypothetical protein [Burkholderia gladioli]|uniref:hypothetical protein n=1 Tax=Burkholderia gladioli TaxID=28095 RepID=UPI001C265176|nr:hypothetical protein [Burkholderia gladioli]MBU9384366.1 hypothetical protein [Burkholderia gladioli]
MSLYRRFYRQKNTPFAGAGLRGIGSSSTSFDHTGLTTALQLPEVDALRHAPGWAAAVGLPQGAFDLELFLQS